MKITFYINTKSVYFNYIVKVDTNIINKLIDLIEINL